MFSLSDCKSSLSLSLSAASYIAKWKLSSASVILTRSPSLTAASKFLSAFSSASRSFSLKFLNAHSYAIFSSVILTCKTSVSIFCDMPATTAPLRGINVTSPSSASFLIASLMGVRLTPIFSASCISISLSPGLSSPFNIACLSVAKTSSRSGMYSSRITVNSELM